jgi:hypothetical protein
LLFLRIGNPTPEKTWRNTGIPVNTGQLAPLQGDGKHCTGQFEIGCLACHGIYRSTSYMMVAHWITDMDF